MLTQKKKKKGQHYITVMDILKLEQYAVDEVIICIHTILPVFICIIMYYFKNPKKKNIHVVDFFKQMSANIT